MGFTVIVAEKPQVARAIGAAIGAKEKPEGYLLNSKNTYVIGAFGHLVKLAEPKYYGWEKWKIEDIPMIPDDFHLELAGDPACKKRYKLIADLLNKADRIIEATDAGREGELIFRYIYHLAGCKKPFERLWISSLTEEAILHGLRHLRPSTDFDNLYLAGKSRSQADWIIGMNYTRLMSLKAGYGEIYSIGRVQTPTLGLIVNRYRQNKSFVPQPFYVPVLELEAAGERFLAKFFDRMYSPDQAEMELMKEGDNVLCVKSTVKQTKEKPPKLYDLTLLQRECNRFFKFSADYTLEIAQSLYERHKIISYPRTDSNYLPEDFKPLLKDHFRFVGEIIKDLGKVCQRLQNGPVSELYIDGNKVSDHHAIIPVINSSADLSKLSADEMTVFSLLAQRFVCAFMPPCERREQELLFINEQEPYRTFRKEILRLGWREIGGRNEDDQGSVLSIQEGDQISVVAKSVETGETTKPALLTEDTLLGLMERAGKEIEDEDLKNEMKSVGLGTVATRAEIIKILYTRKYIEKKKEKLIPTAKGEELYDVVKDLDVAKVDLTAEWEKMLANVEKGNLPYEQFMEKLKQYARRVLAELRDGSTIQIKQAAVGKIYGVCPVCGKPLRVSKAGVGCSGWNKEDANSCRFFIGSTICGAKLTEEDLKRLAQGEQTKKEYSMVSKAGKPFYAKIEIKEGRPAFIFSDTKKKIGRHEKKE